MLDDPADHLRSGQTLPQRARRAEIDDPRRTLPRQHRRQRRRRAHLAHTGHQDRQLGNVQMPRLLLQRNHQERTLQQNSPVQLHGSIQPSRPARINPVENPGEDFHPARE